MSGPELLVLYAPPIILVIAGALAAWGNHRMVKRARERDRRLSGPAGS